MSNVTQELRHLLKPANHKLHHLTGLRGSSPSSSQSYRPSPGLHHGVSSSSEPPSALHHRFATAPKVNADDSGAHLTLSSEPLLVVLDREATHCSDLSSRNKKLSSALEEQRRPETRRQTRQEGEDQECSLRRERPSSGLPL